MTTTNQRASARSLLLAALAFVLVWTWAHISADGSLDAYGDMLENFAWAQQWTWGTHKHPPFVAWVVRLWFAVWPVGDASYKLLAYVNAGVGLLGTLALARVVGLRGLGWLVLAIASWGLPNTTLASKLNADTILLPLWPWVAVAWVQVFEKRAGRGWAVALGVLSALAVLAKYYTGVLLLSLFLSTLASREGRRWYRTGTPWLVLLVFVACLVPHLRWEMAHQWVSFRYVQQHGVPEVVWGDFWRFMLSPWLYWLPAWLGAALLVSPPGERWRCIGQRMLLCWRPTSPGDPLLWIVVMPWLITLVFGLSTFVKLTIHWAIPLGFAYPVYWVRNLAQRYPDAAPLAVAPARRAFGLVLALVALLGPAYGWWEARSGGDSIYQLPRPEAAQALLHQWQERYPGTPLRWVGGQWQENGLMAFYGDRRLFTLPGTPDSELAQAYPHPGWARQGGGLLCPAGWSAMPSLTAEDLQTLAGTLDTECARTARQWLLARGQTAPPLAVSLPRLGWRFPAAAPYAYVLYVYLPPATHAAPGG